MKTINIEPLIGPFHACSERERDFVHLLVEGVPRHKAYKEAFNSKCKISKNLRYHAKKRLEGVAGDYYKSLMSEAVNTQLLPVMLNRDQRLRILSTLVYLCMDEYRTSREPQHANAAIKAISTINTMTGDNAASDINVKHTLINNNLTHLSPNDATQQYHEMMSNVNARLEKITEIIPQDKEENNTEH